MRTADEIHKELDTAIRDFRSAESMIEMMRKSTPESFIDQKKKESEPLRKKVDELKAELAACLSRQ